MSRELLTPLSGVLEVYFIDEFRANRLCEVDPPYTCSGVELIIFCVHALLWDVSSREPCKSGERIISTVTKDGSVCPPSFHIIFERWLHTPRSA